MDGGNVVRAKTRSCAGAETSSAARTIAQQQRRRQHEQMVLTTLDRDRDRDSELLALARLHAVSMLDASFLHRGGDGVRGRRSPERALVRRIARELEVEWAAAAAATSSPREGRGNEEEWLGESERERVRSVRERLRRMACQGYRGEEDEAPSRMRGRARADVVVTRMLAVERQRELQGLSEHHAVSAFVHRGRIQSFLRDRFLRSGRPINDEGLTSITARELGQPRQSNPVSRMREEVCSGIESITSDQSTLVALSTQTNSTGNEYDSVTPQVVSDANNHIENASHNYEILTQQSVQNEDSHIENNVASSNDAHQTDFAQEQIHRYEDYSDSGSSEHDNDHSSYAFPIPSSNIAVQRETETHGGQRSDLPWSRDISGTEDGHDNTFVHRDEEWLVIDSQEPGPNWQLGRSFPSSRNNNRLHPSDDDVYGIELRELLRRRSVSNLLSSGFRESLDQLIRSYVQRQEHDPHGWNFERQRPTTGLLNEDPIEVRIDEHNRAESDTTPQSSAVLPDQTVFPQQRQWYIELPHHNWSQQSMHRSEFDWDTIHILRDELSGVQRGMTSMQQMLEACMEMQIELQRSIKQEVSAALNRSLTMQDKETFEDGSQWKLARKGTCCICCDNHIDSLLYRCGHMCTCSKCASELLHGVGKCPLCRAPIIEVIRAYCIM